MGKTSRHIPDPQLKYKVNAMSLNKMLLAAALMVAFSGVALADEMTAPGGNMAAPSSQMTPADTMAAPDTMGMSSKKPMKAHHHHTKKDAMTAPMATPMGSSMAAPAK